MMLLPKATGPVTVASPDGPIVAGFGLKVAVRDPIRDCVSEHAVNARA